MQKSLMLLLSVSFLAACAQDPYRLKINNSMRQEHGKSIYFRSNMRSSYAGQIRSALSKRFALQGLKTATLAANADFIAIFDVENFYPQNENNTTFVSSVDTAPLFTSDDESTSMDYTGNSNIKVDREQTCFTLKIGPKDTSVVKYSSTLCTGEIYETEDFIPQIIDIYSKYGNYESADIGVQCLEKNDGNISCDPVHDRQQAFINSLWINSEITED